MKALSILFLFFPLLLVAQDRQQAKAERQERAEAMVNVLRTGGLVVRLTTNTKKIAAMQKVLTEGRLSPVNHQRLKERVATTIAETQEQNELIVSLLRDQYKIGPLYFIPDTTLVLLKNEEADGFFLNDDLVIDPSIDRPEEFIVMRTGYTDASTSSRAEAFILSYNDDEDLQSPFPSAITFNNLGYVFNRTLAPEIAERRRMEGAVNRLITKLNTAIALTLEE